jgi:hypothetical protein
MMKTKKVATMKPIKRFRPSNKFNKEQSAPNIRPSVFRTSLEPATPFPSPSPPWEGEGEGEGEGKGFTGSSESALNKPAGAPNPRPIPNPILSPKPLINPILGPKPMAKPMSRNGPGRTPRATSTLSLANAAKAAKAKKVAKAPKAAKAAKAGKVAKAAKIDKVDEGAKASKSLKERAIKALNQVEKIQHEKVLTKASPPRSRPRIIGRYYLDRLFYSHLDFKYYKDQLRNLGWAETKDPRTANMILCSYWKNIMKWIPTLMDPRFSHRRLVIWTHEPYHDLHKQDANKVSINNVYTGTVFKDNYRYFRWGEKDLLSELTDAMLTDAEFEARKFPLLALSTKYPKTYWNQNKLTLLPKRYEVIEYGLKHQTSQVAKITHEGVINNVLNEETSQVAKITHEGVINNVVNEETSQVAKITHEGVINNVVKMCKVWGKGWPDGLKEGESRSANNREEEKRKILRSGLFNVAIENTEVPFYITEKIWESIESYCLPIYWSNSTIYQDFPVDSFIDAKTFYEKWGEQHWTDKLYKYIQQMTKREYIERLNRCIRTFNLLCTKGLAKNLRTDAKHRDLHLIDYSRNWEDFKKIFI